MRQRARYSGANEDGSSEETREIEPSGQSTHLFFCELLCFFQPLAHRHRHASLEARWVLRIDRHGIDGQSPQLEPAREDGSHEAVARDSFHLGLAELGLDLGQLLLDLVSLLQQAREVAHPTGTTTLHVVLP